MIKNSTLLLFIIFCSCTIKTFADSDNLRDTCPTDTATVTASKQPIFYMNGFPCKNPNNTTASDFKSSFLNNAGKTDNPLSSSMNIVTAERFPGLNTLSLSVARTDLEVDGMIMPHSHPRASEMFYLSKGVMIAGFIDTNTRLFQKKLKAGDVFVFPQGLLHFCLNNGYETAVGFSVLNSQNPGMVSIADVTAMFESDLDPDVMNKLVRKIKLVSGLNGTETETETGKFNFV